MLTPAPIVSFDYRASAHGAERVAQVRRVLETGQAFGADYTSAPRPVTVARIASDVRAELRSVRLRRDVLAGVLAFAAIFAVALGAMAFHLI